MKKLTIFFVMLLAVTAFAQIQVKPYQTTIKYFWEADTTGDVAEQMVFFCWGQDSTLFPFTENSAFSSDIDSYRRAVITEIGFNQYEYFYFELPKSSTWYYARLGVMNIGFDGTTALMRTKTILVKPIIKSHEIKISR